jgi:hypothetical protein
MSRAAASPVQFHPPEIEVAMPFRLQMREGWFSLLLLFLLLLSVTVSLQAARWAPGLEILTSVVIVALALGVLFAKSRLSGFLLHPLALALGTLWVGYQSLNLVEEAPWREQLTEVSSRLLTWIEAWSTGGASADALTFVLTMAGLMWLIAYGAAWDYYRARNIWGVLLPSGVTILINTYYARENLHFLLLFFMIVAFLLVIRSNLFEKQERWRSERVAFSEDIQFDFLRDGAVFAVAIAAVAWFLPTSLIAPQNNTMLTQLSQPWGRAQQEWGRLFSTLTYQGVSSGSWFSSSMSFHGPINRTDSLVMHVTARQGRYWRAVAHDTYTSAGWMTTDQRVLDGMIAGEFLPGSDSIAGRTVVEQQYTMYAPAGRLLFSAGQPMQVGLDSEILLGGPAATTPEPTADAIAQLFARLPLYQGQSYSVLSAVSTVDEESLRRAGTAYPDWLLEHYTSLPDTVPVRVHELARQLASSAATPYDAALIIEQYLRLFPYNEAIAGPRPGEDGVDYFLFREQQGYCDYYASAMGVMLRSVGIPARVVRGYGQGMPLDAGVYEVRQNNAHTWVEVYFPGYGWIEFEPTAAEPAIERIARASDPFEEDDGVLPAPGLDGTNPMLGLEDLDPMSQMQGEMVFTSATPQSTLLNPRNLLLPIAVLGVLAMIGTGGWTLLQRRWRGLDTVERFYDQFALFGRALGQRPDPALTPQEYAEQIGEQVPPARSAIQRLAELFSKRRFASRPLETDEVADARTSWREARRALLERVVRHRTRIRRRRKSS